MEFVIFFLCDLVEEIPKDKFQIPLLHMLRQDGICDFLPL
jgi:hypothetical protein